MTPSRTMPRADRPCCCAHMVDRRPRRASRSIPPCSSGPAAASRTWTSITVEQWGLVDGGDCVAGAKHLVDAGAVDPDRLFIHGGSAGGYVVLCAMTFHDV